MDVTVVIDAPTTALPHQLCMQELLARLHALYAVHRSAHWTVWGDTYYGDHLLFQRLYEPLDDEIDTLAERMVAAFDPSVVEASALTAATAGLVEEWCAEEPCPYERALRVEAELVACVNCCMHAVELAGMQTLGWDDFLGRVASKHEEHVYLLKRRLESR